MILPLLLLCAGCANFPALEGTISDAARQAPYPKLTPLPEAAVRAPQDVADAKLTARITALNARAARLRRTDIAALQ